MLHLTAHTYRIIWTKILLMNIDQLWDEQWKPVIFEGIKQDESYEISNYGRVRSYRDDLEKWKLLKTSNQKKDGSGYVYFRFKSDRENGKAMTKAIHRLVAQLFVKSPSEECDYVIHKDYNKSNNHYKNLIWVTRAGLVEHNKNNPKVIAGHERTKGLIRRSKLTETEVIRLKKKLKRGKNKLYKIAKEFGITHTQLNRIRSGENWGHIKVD